MCCVEECDLILLLFLVETVLAFMDRACLPFASVVVKVKAQLLVSLHFTFARRHSSRRMKQAEHTGISIMHTLGHILVYALNVTSDRTPTVRKGRWAMTVAEFMTTKTDRRREYERPVCWGSTSTHSPKAVNYKSSRQARG